ncbi:MAG: alpha/beta hydrolase [Firmicutes bacterium]|nr:alpha/beta hydrolase [Bacillota bacterium]
MTKKPKLKSPNGKERVSFWAKLKAILKSHHLLWISLLLVLIGSSSASIVQTNGGTIDVSSFTLQTVDGQYIVADLFKPKTATAATPAPCVIVVPGFQRTKETQIGMSLELARRGIVVITIDPYSQGDSTATYQIQSATNEGYGLIPMTEFVYASNIFNYVQKDRIGAAGHSAGGNGVLLAANYFGKQAIDGIVPQSKLHSIYVSGYVITLTAETLAPIRSNVGIAYAYYDEGAYRNELASDPTYTGWLGDMRTAPEAIRTINSGLTLEGDDPVTSVEIGRVYGNPNDLTMRIVNNEKIVHALQPYDPTSIAHVVEFFDIAMNLNMTMSYMNQTYLIKELANTISLVGGFLFIIGVAGLFFLIPFFKKGIVFAAPAPTPKPTKVGTLLNYGALIIGATIACLIFIPMCQASTTLFADANGGRLTWFFPERMNNGVMLWAIVSGCVGFVIFFATYFISKAAKRPMVSLEGFKISWKAFFKTLLFAVMVFAALFLLVGLSYLIFHIDFRSFFLAIRPINKVKYLIVLLMYVPFFFIFYFSNSIRVSMVNRYEGHKEWLSNLIAVLANIIGLFGVIAIQYITFATTKTVYYTDNWLFVNMLLSVIPMMAILPLFNRYFFKKTGRPYLGALITCLIFIMMMLMHSVAYIPIFL